MKFFRFHLRSSLTESGYPPGKLRPASTRNGFPVFLHINAIYFCRRNLPCTQSCMIDHFSVRYMSVTNSLMYQCAKLPKE